MGNNPSHFQGCDNCPVEEVSWNEVLEFIRRLNSMQGRYTYRLPTEAEWEYAARAGTATPFAHGNSLSSSQANFDGTGPYGGALKGVNLKKTVPVGSYRPNGWGLYDMHGNVWEWCQSKYMPYPYNTDGRESVSAGNSDERVLRGGSWGFDAYFVRSASRGRSNPSYHNLYGHGRFGFRLAASRT
jgi:formylglycine-generating enzyme required for sulfatase activity